MWRGEAASEVNPKTVSYYKKKKLCMKNENDELKKRLRMLTIQEKKI